MNNNAPEQLPPPPAEIIVKSEVATTTKPKFRNEGEGLPASSLDTGYTPVYYGFNCRPRQVRYYKVEKSVELILDGSVSRSNTEAFLAKVKVKQEKAIARLLELDEKTTRADNAFRNGTSSDARKYAVKERNRLATAHYNHSFTVDGYTKAVESVEKYLAE